MQVCIQCSGRVREVQESIVRGKIWLINMWNFGYNVLVQNVPKIPGFILCLAQVNGEPRILWWKICLSLLTHLRVQVTCMRWRNEGGMKPGQAVVRAATDEHAHMVVIGTRGMGTIRRTILGSVSDYVVHHAHCPVVVCRHVGEVLNKHSPTSS